MNGVQSVNLATGIPGDRGQFAMRRSGVLSQAGETAFAPELSQHQRNDTREAAAQLVSSALILPVLEQLRESNMAEGPFAPGAGEKRFAPMFDTLIADRLTAAANFPLLDAIERRITANAAAEANATHQQPSTTGVRTTDVTG